MKRQDYHDNPLSPPLLSEMESHTVVHAIKSDAGTLLILNDKEDDYPFPYFFFSPRNKPTHFYAMYNVAGDGGLPTIYTFLTDSSPAYMHLYFFDTNFAAQSYSTYSDSNNAPDLREINDDECQIWLHVDDAERSLIESNMHAGRIKFYAYPANHRISEIFVPPSSTGLEGAIVLTSHNYGFGHGSYYVPSDTTKHAQWISFFDRESGKQLSYSDLTYNYPLLKQKTFDIEIGQEGRRTVDFTGTTCVNRYHESGQKFIRELSESGCVPNVSGEAPCLVTPLTEHEIFPDKPTPLTSAPKPPSP